MTAANAEKNSQNDSLQSDRWLEAELVDRIRARIRAGTLPRDPDALSYDSIGEGTRCACCDRPIRDFNYQREVQLSKSGKAVRYIYLHDSCYDQWREVAAAMLHPRT